MAEQDSRKDLEKYLVQSKKAIIGHIITMVLTVFIAIGIKFIWDPRWWIYVLVLWAGPYGLIGDYSNIWYCKKKLKSMTE
jgi:hypothetical protein